MMLKIFLLNWLFVRLFVYEYGPFDIFDTFRKFVGVYNIDERSGRPSSFIGKIFICTHCLSFYTVPIAGILVFYFPNISLLLSAVSLTILVEVMLEDG